MTQREALLERARRKEELERAAIATTGPMARPRNTRAEDRPNAYIPEDLAIPRPYGTLAPFKPTAAGANMRHIRKPQPKEIQL